MLNNNQLELQKALYSYKHGLFNSFDLSSNIENDFAALESKINRLGYSIKKVGLRPGVNTRYFSKDDVLYIDVSDQRGNSIRLEETPESIEEVKEDKEREELETYNNFMHYIEEPYKRGRWQ